VPDADAPVGTFELRVSRGEDAWPALTIGDPSSAQPRGHYRVLVFVNGGNMGQYVADVGPQHTFVRPAGIVNPHGHNTLAPALTSDGGAGNALERVRLANLATARGGVGT